jgi:hypothetical protein
MPNTYTLISSNVLSSTAASVTFSAIPATFTDLVLKMSFRGSNGGQIYDDINFRFNSTNNNYSGTRLTGDGSAAASSNTSNATNLRIPYFGAGSTSTTSTFSSAELYIPNYNSANQKPFGGFGTGENNSSTSYMNAIAALWGQTAAINEIQIFAYTSANFVAGSSFYLYGIKNS